MVDDDSGRIATLEGIGLEGAQVVVARVEVPQADADKPDNDVAGLVDDEAPPGNRYAVTGCGLTGDGQVAVPYGQRAVKVDSTRDPEDDRPRPAGLDSGPQGTRTAVVKVGNLNDGTTATTGNIPAKPLGPGKGEGSGLGRQGHGKR